MKDLVEKYGLITMNEVDCINMDEYFPMEDDFHEKCDFIEKKYFGSDFKEIVEDLQCIKIQDVYVVNWNPKTNSSNWLYICKGCFGTPALVSNAVKKISLHTTVLRKSGEIFSWKNIEERCIRRREYLCARCKNFIFALLDINECIDCYERLNCLFVEYICDNINLC